MAKMIDGKRVSSSFRKLSPASSFFFFVLSSSSSYSSSLFFFFLSSLTVRLSRLHDRFSVSAHRFVLKGFIINLYIHMQLLTQDCLISLFLHHYSQITKNIYICLYHVCVHSFLLYSLSGSSSLQCGASLQNPLVSRVIHSLHKTPHVASC